MEDFKTFLREIAPVSQAALLAAEKVFAPITLNKGDFFVEMGTVCRHAAFIRSGIIRSFYINGKGEETTYCFCACGSLSTSFRSFITQTASELSMHAIEQAELLVVSREDLYTLYRQYPDWQEIGRVMTEKAYLGLEGYASTLNNETARQKYTRLLAEQPHIAQRASIQDIASYLGVSRETISRIRREMSTPIL